MEKNEKKTKRKNGASEKRVAQPARMRDRRVSNRAHTPGLVPRPGRVVVCGLAAEVGGSTTKSSAHRFGRILRTLVATKRN